MKASLLLLLLFPLLLLLSHCQGGMCLLASEQLKNARCDELRLVSFIVAAAAATAAAARGVCVMCWQINKFQYLFIRRASARLITGYTAGAQYERGAWQHPRREWKGGRGGRREGGKGHPLMAGNLASWARFSCLPTLEI